MSTKTQLAIHYGVKAKIHEEATELRSSFKLYQKTKRKIDDR